MASGGALKSLLRLCSSAGDRADRLFALKAVGMFSMQPPYMEPPAVAMRYIVNLGGVPIARACYEALQPGVREGSQELGFAVAQLERFEVMMGREGRTRTHAAGQQPQSTSSGASALHPDTVVPLRLL